MLEVLAGEVLFTEGPGSQVSIFTDADGIAVAGLIANAPSTVLVQVSVPNTPLVAFAIFEVVPPAHTWSAKDSIHQD